MQEIHEGTWPLPHDFCEPKSQPLRNSNSANVDSFHPAPSQLDSNFSIAGALPECLLTPAKGAASTNFVGLRCAKECDDNAQDENIPPAADSSAIRQSIAAHSTERQQPVASTSTPTSVFRRLNTRSPSSSTDITTEHCLTQLFFAKTDNAGMYEMAANGQKRIRPVQRGIHPAEINKRITNAQECWHILDIVNNFGAEFDAVNVATALHRIAKQRPDDSKNLVASDTFKQLVMMVDIQVTPRCL